MINLGLKSTFSGLYNTVVKKRELIIEEVHIFSTIPSQIDSYSFLCQLLLNFKMYMHSFKCKA